MNDRSAHLALPLTALEDHGAFVGRHIGTDAADQAEMLRVLGYPTRAALIDALVPAAIREREALPLPGPMTEAEALAALRSIASSNVVAKSFIGQGYYGTHTPGVIQRNILENPAWYTAYTPYQPEISQGRLEALVNFQTMVCDLTGMAIANASMLDEATAAAEAMTLCQRMGKSTSTRFFVSDEVLPQTLDVVRTRAAALDIEVVVGPAGASASADVFGVLLQYPAVNGDVRDYAAVVAAVHAAGGHVVVAADLLALTLLKPPGEWGADAVVGTSQRFGVPMGYGGPARRLPRDARRVQALAAWAPRWRHGRRAGHARVSTRAADARAAHPPREGDVEHLHGAGAACGDGEHVRRLPRAGRTDDDRAPRAPADRDPAPGTAAARHCRSHARVLRHAAGRLQRRHRGHRRARERGERQPAPQSASGRSASRSTKQRRATTSRCCGASSRAATRRSRSTRSTPRPPTPCPRNSRARRRFSRIRCSTGTAPRPRCCVTCARWPTAISRSTAR